MSMPTLTFPVQKNDQVAFGLVTFTAVILLCMVVMRLLSGLKEGSRFKLGKLPFFMKEESGYHTLLYVLLLSLVVIALFMLCSSL